ncbi:solute carrier family protein [Aureococcus anophagefferens]|uniref:Solute carrier family protein n=1 Tax=Aureococcus anophagefferens TaxID=44056 RepID=A0ABR1GDM1_AURAN|nr:hypothetical protein JL721_4689 [Aureococcus anophagefferens]
MANPFAPGAAMDVREPLLGFDRAASRRRTLQGRALVMAVAFASVSLALLNTRPRAEPVSALDQSYPVLSLEREVATLRDESTTGWLTLALEFLAAVLACLVALDARELLRAPAVAAEEVEGGKSAAAFQLTRGIAVAPSEAKILRRPVADSDDGGAARARELARSAALVVLYMAAAIGIVYVNAYVLHVWRYAATLCFAQMTFCSACAAACCRLGLGDPAACALANRRTYATIALPLAGLYATFLYGSNAVYAYLPVGYIQVLKVSQAFVVYVLLACAGEEAVAPKPLLNLAVILGAVAVASVAQARLEGFSAAGFVLMMVSNAAYALYLVGQQLVLNGRAGASPSGKRRPLDALTTLYFLGPPTALALGVGACATEWTAPGFSLADAPVGAIAGDCVIAFALNLVQIAIVKRLSALAYMFAGYLKGALTVAIAVVGLGEPVDAVEVCAYALMLGGQVVWSLRKLRNKRS